ncbi:twin-arginine translocase TatA/TatE family subunit [Acuticoccus kandeliae]|uniref:twin-arginine translocase TatA/TatE family subunit n=1 Tax=Acuticoccus kandeliae TaxID=2073160 RepID=UPI000D3E96DC|nr:twin-arginine translocase TatA/TatE family subunit [Acuticoccus kandeliae]
MGSFSIGHWVIVLVVIMILFGRGKISEIMGDVAKGVKSFKKGLAEEEEAHAHEPRAIAHAPAALEATDAATSPRASA